MKSAIIALLVANTAAIQKHHHKHHKTINPHSYVHATEDLHEMETLEAMSTEKLVSGLRNTLNLALEAESRDDKAAAVAKTAAIKNIQKALTARILKRLDDGQPLVEVARKMKAIEGMQPQINDMERRLGIMQSVEPVLENAIKTLQKVVDVRGMGKALVQLDEPENENQLLLDELMMSLGDEEKKEEAPAKEEKKEEAPAKEEKKEEAKEEKKEEGPKKAKKKCEWKPPALEAEDKKEAISKLPPKGKAEAAAKDEKAAEEKKEEGKDEAAAAKDKDAPEAPKKEEKKEEAKKEEGKEEKKEEGKEEKKEEAAAAPAEEDCEPLDKDEKAAAKKEYESIRAAEKSEKAAEKAELDHKSSTMEQIRSKAYWDHMNEGLKLIGKMKDGIQTANETAYGNRGITATENEKANKEADAAKAKEEEKEFLKV